MLRTDEFQHFGHFVQRSIFRTEALNINWLKPKWTQVAVFTQVI